MAAGPTSPDALGCDLGWALGVAFRAYVAAADDALGALPGGPRGYQVLVAAATEPAASQGAVARRLGVDRTVMTYLVDALEAAGLLARRPDPADRRHRLLVATAKGRRTVRTLEARLARAEEHLLAPLDAAARDRLRRLLQRVALAAEERDPLADLCEAAVLVRPGGPRASR